MLPERLDRATYSRVSTVLNAAGGRWNRAVGAHLFATDAREVVDAMILTRTVVSDRVAFGYVPTPPGVLDRVLAAADLHPGQTVLEPSAGCGVIARAAHAAGGQVDCVEIRHDAALALQASGLYGRVVCDDFLTLPVDRCYDRIAMNPPFGKQADLRHVRRAFDWLAPGGRLAAVMASGVLDRGNAASQEFRRFLDDHQGAAERLPETAFRSAGVTVATILVTLDKAAS